ncbi:MAG: hypothetical protein R3A45_03220 [Bdellovibrionota bacterium]
MSAQTPKQPSIVFKFRLHSLTPKFGFHYLQQTIPIQYESDYQKLVETICNLSDPLFANIPVHRIHGAIVIGAMSIYREDAGMFLIDFDDMLIGPAIQDIWLLIPGDDTYALQDRQIFLEAYQSMRDFDISSLRLIEPLRTLRYIHFTA